MKLETFAALLRRELSLTDEEFVKILQKAYDYTVNKIRLDVYAVPVIVEGVCNLSDCWIYKDGSRFSEVGVKHLAALNDCNIITETQTGLRRNDLKICKWNSELSGLTGLGISWNHNSLSTAEAMAGAVALMHIRPYLVNVNPYDEAVMPSIQCAWDYYMGREVNSLLLSFVSTKFKELAFSEQGYVSEASTFDYLFVQMLNAYNKNFDQLRISSLSRISGFHPDYNSVYVNRLN